MSVYSTWLFLRPLKREREWGREERGREGSECRRLRTNLLRVLSWRAAPEPERVITAAHKLLSVSCKLHDKVISTPCWERGETRVERERGGDVASEWENESKSDKKSECQKSKMPRAQRTNTSYLPHSHTHTHVHKSHNMFACLCVCVCNNMTLTNVQRAARCCVLWHTHATTDRRQRHTDGTNTRTYMHSTHMWTAHTHAYSHIFCNTLAI